MTSQKLTDINIIKKLTFQGYQEGSDADILAYIMSFGTFQGYQEGLDP
jgi:hypothetical protein